MQTSLSQEIEKYVSTKRSLWSNVTTRNVGYTLNTLGADLRNPAKSYQKLITGGKSRHTIRTYFLIAQRFEQECFGTNKFNVFLKSNASAFKNCYREKTRLLKDTEFELFKSLYKESHPKMYNLLVLMGEAGLRISEALSVKWSDFEEGYLKVVGKGGKQRLIPLKKEKLLSQQTTPDPYVVGRVSYRFHFRRDMRPFSPHDFRAYFATRVANHPELNIKDAALLLGHSDIKTTSRYIRTDLNRIAKVLSK